MKLPLTKTPDASLPTRDDLDQCRRCGLWERATQGVPGTGPSSARMLFVGEQPGDEEDRQGLPFVGPAGQLLRLLMEKADIDSRQVFLTNAVKHFGWEPRGNRRMHKTPGQREMEACHVWLEAELMHVQPKVVVALGVTALSALLRRRLTLRAARTMKLVLPEGIPLVATYHPSALLRAPDAEARGELEVALLADLHRAATIAGH